jgi:hypothetical protein
MRTFYLLLTAAAAFAWLASPAEAAKTYQYSQQVQRACANDYHAKCGEYGIETEAVRICMNKVGHSLSHGCVDALVADGQVSRAEVERRKHGGR